MFSVLFCFVCMHACVNECVCSVLSLVLLPCLLSAIFHFKCCYNITYKFNSKELSSVSAPISLFCVTRVWHLLQRSQVRASQTVPRHDPQNKAARQAPGVPGSLHLPPSLNEFPQAWPVQSYNPGNKDPGSTLMGQRSDTITSDRCMMDVDPNIFVFWKLYWMPCKLRDKNQSVQQLSVNILTRWLLDSDIQILLNID